MGLENPLHIIFLLVLALIVFGAKRLPEMGRQLGTGMREFKEGVTGAATQGAITEHTSAAVVDPHIEASVSGPRV